MASSMNMMIMGPPELHRPPPPVGGDSVDSMTANLKESLQIQEKPPKGFTENHSPTFLTTGNPCLDLFFHVVPNTPPESIQQRLNLAWAHNPLETLKLIFNLRGVRGTGKSDKEGFYTAALWLHNHHPKTLAGNIAAVADFGYFKDLPEILYRLLHGSEIRKIEKAVHTEWKRRGYKPKKKEEAAESKSEKRLSRAKKAVERIARDSDFRSLYDRVTDLFADHLKSDIQFLEKRELTKISLASKWCPSIDSSFDRATLICELIAKKIFPRESHPEYEGVEDAHYAYRVRDRLRKEILVPLHKTLDLPEVYMCSKQWNSLPYNRVPSVAMKVYKSRFVKHDGDRFTEYLEKVKAGTAKIAAGALLPHEIIKSLEDDDCGSEVAELQWKRMVEDVRQKGKMSNCLAISDVSGSMSGIPMEVAVALGVLVSELCEEPWKGKLITFSQEPKLQKVEGESLREKTSFVREMEWGLNTDFQKVFDQILEVAVNGKLKEEEMIKRLFVFSDMEFDEASKNDWEADYEAIQRKFTEKGFGNAVPEMVFWNLRDSRATPVPSNQKGVALVSGFSKNLLTMFLEDGGIMNPEAVMEAAISGKEYQKLVVLD